MPPGMDAIQQKYHLTATPVPGSLRVRLNGRDVVLSDGITHCIAETWRCLGEASAWAAFEQLADDEGTYGNLTWGGAQEQVGTRPLRVLLGLEDGRGWP